MDFSRQTLLVPDSVSSLSVLVIGAGSLGSNTTNILARMGVGNLLTFDRDTLKEENLAPSCSGLDWLGENKARAIAEKIQVELDIAVAFNTNNYIGQRTFAEVVVVTVDSIAARREIWKSRSRIDGLRLWIDARMGKDQGGIYVWRGEQDTEWYEKSLSREEAPLECGQKATAPICAGLIPGFVGVAVMRYLRGLSVPRGMFAKVLLADMPFISVDMGPEEPDPRNMD